MTMCAMSAWTRSHVFKLMPRRLAAMNARAPAAAPTARACWLLRFILALRVVQLFAQLSHR
jgi:hypothetical protein